MITNYENLFTVLDADPGWKGGTGGGFIETVLMTDTRPRGAIRIGQERDGYRIGWGVGGPSPRSLAGPRDDTVGVGDWGD